MNILFSIALILLAHFSTGHADNYSLIQYLNIQSATNPNFNSDGTELMYKTNISGVSQMWRMPIVFGRSYQFQVTFDTNGVDAAWWSPSNQNLMVVSAAVGGNENTQLYLTNPYGGEWKSLSKDKSALYAFGGWKRDGSKFAYASNERNKKDFDIFEYDVATDSAKILYTSDGSNRAVGYSPDGGYLLISKSYSNVNNDLFLYDRQSDSTRLLTKHKGDAQYINPTWRPDGKSFYLLTDQGKEFVGIAQWSLNNASFAWIETPKNDIEDVKLSPFGDILTWSVNVGGYSQLHIRNLQKETEIGPYRLPQGVVSNIVFSNDGGKIALSFNSGVRPSDIWIYDARLDKMTQLTQSATGGISIESLREPELVEYKSFDGKKIPALFYTPSQVKGKMPVIVVAHGGPESQSKPSISGLYQYFLKRGYGILLPNVRGSTGYGKTFASLDNVKKRMDSVKDFEYAAKWLTARNDVDKNKLVVFGGSYGGFMTLSALTTYPDRWATGVSIVGIANFVTFLEKTASYRRALREAEYGSLEKDREFLKEISPINHVDKIKAPLFLIQGANDPRVPKGEADQMAEAIRAKNGIVEYLLFQDEGHGLLKTANKIRAYTAVSDFLDKYVMSK